MEFLSLHSRTDALAQLARFGADAAVLAGGTVIMLLLSRGEIAPHAVLHVEAVRELASHRPLEPRPLFGPLVANRVIATDQNLRRCYRGLTQAAGQCGSWQTQSVGTIGGNVCAASPTSDLLPSLLVHGAVVTLQAQERQDRRLKLEDFLVGQPRTARQPDELLTGIDLDPITPRTADTYRKVGRRGAMEVALVGLAVRLSLAADDSIADIRIGVGAVAPRAFRATGAEALLRGQHISDALLREAGEALVRQADPRSDRHASKAYRQTVLPRLLAQATRDCVQAAAGNS